VPALNGARCPCAPGCSRYCWAHLPRAPSDALERLVRQVGRLFLRTILIRALLSIKCPMEFRSVDIKVIGPILWITFFAFVQIHQLVVSLPTLNVWDLTITMVFGIFDGRSPRPLVPCPHNSNFDLFSINGLHMFLTPVNPWANCSTSMLRLDQNL
jgi:hypothetical protein